MDRQSSDFSIVLTQRTRLGQVKSSWGRGPWGTMTAKEGVREQSRARRSGCREQLCLFELSLPSFAAHQNSTGPDIM